MPKRALIFFITGLFLASVPGFAQEKSEAKPMYVDKIVHLPATKFDPKRDAAQDIQNATVEAKRTGKRVLLDVGGDWCIWCRRLDSLFVANRDLADLLHKEFVVVKVNWSKENKNEAVLSRYPKIPGYPHLFVLDSDAKLLHSQDTSELESGNHHDREKVMAFLKKWGPVSTGVEKGK